MIWQNCKIYNAPASVSLFYLNNPKGGLTPTLHPTPTTLTK